MKFKTLPPEDIYSELNTSKSGLSPDEVEKCLTEYVLNQIE